MELAALEGSWGADSSASIRQVRGINDALLVAGEAAWERGAMLLAQNGHVALNCTRARPTKKLLELRGSTWRSSGSSRS